MQCYKGCNMEPKLPQDCLLCPKVNNLHAALLVYNLELTKENLLKILDSLPSCQSKRVEEVVISGEK